MKGYPTLFAKQQHVYRTRLSPEECCERFCTALNEPFHRGCSREGPVEGVMVPPELFVITGVPRSANGARTLAMGKLHGRPDGTQITVVLSAMPIVQQSILVTLGIAVAAMVISAIQRGVVSILDLLYLILPVVVYKAWARLRAQTPDEGPLLLDFVRKTLEVEASLGAQR